MTLHRVRSFVAGGLGDARRERAPHRRCRHRRGFAEAGHGGLDFASVRDFAITKGGPALRAMGFHDRARMLKALATYLNERKEPLYRLSHRTGATMADNRIDIDGGIGTMFVIASKGRREMPDGDVYLDGGLEMLSRAGQLSSASMSARRFRASPSISTPSTFPSGGCWRNSRRRCWPACPRS
jgi:oxepin-CoA hydrolase/3-oxo-5,6-dehydrosuberyl-CoA semialdehyde dehydrogenase